MKKLFVSIRSQINRPAVYWPLLLTFLAFFLNLDELDDLHLWADEGYTLIYSHYTLRWGVPKLFDETYRFCYPFAVTKDGVYVFHPWLQFYVTAAMLALFGPSVFFLRLPFALIGALGTPLLWILCGRLKFSLRSKILACLLLATNVQFILLNRNVRYYAFAPFFTILLLIFYSDLRDKRYSRWWAFGLSAAFFMYAMHPVCVAVVGTLFLHALIKERSKVFWKHLIKACLIPFFLYLPFFLYSWKTVHNDLSHLYSSALSEKISFSAIANGGILHVLNLLKFNFPTMLLLVLLGYKICGVRLKKPVTKAIPLLVALFLAICFFMALIFNVPMHQGYVNACLPILCLLAALTLESVAQERKWLLTSLTAIFMTTNLLNLPYWPWKKPGLNDQISYMYAQPAQRPELIRDTLVMNHFDSLFYGYMTELATDYVGPLEAMIPYIKDHSKPEDTFFATHDQEVLHLFTGLKRIQSIPFPKPPTWIIRRAMMSWVMGACADEIATGFEPEPYVNDFLKTHPYEMIVLDAPDFPHENVPFAPFQHRWSTIRYKLAKNPRRVTLYHYRDDLEIKSP